MMPISSFSLLSAVPHYRAGACQRLFLALLLPGAIPSGLAAQEPAHPAPVLERREGERGGTWNFLVNRRARLGVSVNLLARETDSIGAWIQAVIPNGPAARAGIRTGDVLTRFNGVALVGVKGTEATPGQSAPGVTLVRLAAGLEPGDTAVIEFRRGTEARTVRVVAGDEPAMAWTDGDGAVFSLGPIPEEARQALRQLERERATAGARARAVDSLRGTLEPLRLQVESLATRPHPMLVLGTPLEGFELAPMNPDLGRYFGTDEGILVIRVPGAGNLGLQGGDVVLRVGGRTPAGPAHLLRILRSYEPGETVRFDIVRMKKRWSVTGQAGR